MGVGEKLLKDELNIKILALSLCSGAGAASRIQMISALMEDGCLSVSELASAGKLSRKNRELFVKSYAAIDAERVMEDHQKQKISWVTILEEHYPEYLKQIYDPPILLFYQGDLTLIDRTMLAIVGARMNSSYGTAVLDELLPELIDNGIVTVSGLAKGIDAEVHRKTLKNGGRTIAVIGCGLDVYYPWENKRLQQEIAENHLLISEYSLGSKPKKAHFPMRNRIIAGLSMGTLVIEANYRSGSLITANLALREGREVFAVPGAIISPLSAGPNDLILNGAKCVLSAQQILEELQF